MLISRNRKSSMKRFWLILFLALSIVVAVVAWLRTESYRPIAESRVTETMYNLDNEPLQPLQPTIKLNEKKVSLGEKLFNDPPAFTHQHHLMFQLPLAQRRWNGSIGALYWSRTAADGCQHSDCL